MGDIIRGTSSLSGLYRGSTEIQAVYRGTQEIWSGSDALSASDFDVRNMVSDNSYFQRQNETLSSSSPSWSDPLYRAKWRPDLTPFTADNVSSSPTKDQWEDNYGVIEGRMNYSNGYIGMSANQRGITGSSGTGTSDGSVIRRSAICLPLQKIKKGSNTLNVVVRIAGKYQQVDQNKFGRTRLYICEAGPPDTLDGNGILTSLTKGSQTMILDTGQFSNGYGTYFNDAALSFTSTQEHLFIMMDCETNAQYGYDFSCRDIRVN